MPVIAFAISKGESGKTTGALLPDQALSAHRPGTLIDADPRHPITTWAEKPGRPETLSVVTNASKKTILDEIEETANSDLFVSIDREGTASRLMSYALSQADLVVIPLKEQQQDAVPALDVIQEIHRDMKATRRKIPYSVLFTQSRAAVKPRTGHRAPRAVSRPSSAPMISSMYSKPRPTRAMPLPRCFPRGSTVAGIPPKLVNGLPQALESIEAFRAEVITKLRAIRDGGKGRAA